MAEKGVWRTIRGRRVFIKECQSLSDAMRESGKFKKQNRIYKTLEEQIKYIEENQDDLYKIIEDSDNPDKDICIYMQEQNGFNNKPSVLSSDNFNKLSDDDYIKVFRGYPDGEKTAKEYIEQFKYGENQYGTGGTQYGVGHYTITDKSGAEQYGETIEIAIPKSANIIEYDDLLNQHYTNFEKYNNDLEGYYNKYGDKITTVLDSLNSNESSTAILSGYDVVKKDNMYIILNRGIVSVKGGKND